MENAYTHIVLKREDVFKYLEEPEQVALDVMMEKIMRGREEDGKKRLNSYYVVNKDEPYAEVVHGVILGGEAVKEKGEKAMYEVEANSMGCTFAKEEDAIKAFMMALAMEEDINISELEKKIKYDLNNTKNNMYEHNYYMSIRKVN